MLCKLMDDIAQQEQSHAFLSELNTLTSLVLVLEYGKMFTCRFHQAKSVRFGHKQYQALDGRAG